MCQVSIYEIVTRYGKLCGDEREQRLIKLKDIDLVLGISPFYHLCHIWVHSRLTILHKDIKTSIHRAHR